VSRLNMCGGLGHSTTLPHGFVLEQRTIFYILYLTLDYTNMADVRTELKAKLASLTVCGDRSSKIVWHINSATLTNTGTNQLIKKTYYWDWKMR